MYQDKIEEKANAALLSQKEPRKHKNIFAQSQLAPLDFLPDEDTCDATHIARDILSKRSNEEIITLSESIDYMLHIGENLLEILAMNLLKNSTTRKSITLTQGRALYLLCDYFDLSTLDIKNAQWSELFATLTLMQSAEIVRLSQETHEQDEFFKEAIQQSKLSCIQQLHEEIIDSIARAECIFDKKKVSTSSGSAGGEAKAKRIEPLKVEVIKQYLKISHEVKSFRRAGMIIEAELESMNSELLELSESEEKNILFSKWIGAFKNGKWKMPL